MYEVEQKFVVDNPAAVIAALARLGATLDAPTSQADLYLSHPARDFAVTDEALRLRRDGSTNALTYKGPRIDPTTKTRLELEIPLAEGDRPAEDALEIFTRLGFSVVADVHKERRHATIRWQGATLVVAVDEVQHLGHFAEIETIAANADAIDAARATIASLATELGLTRNQRKSYCELLLEFRSANR